MESVDFFNRYGHSLLLDTTVPTDTARLSVPGGLYSPLFFPYSGGVFLGESYAPQFP